MRPTPSYVIVAVLALAVVTPSAAMAELKSKEIEYKQGDATLLGYLVWDDAAGQAKRPGVLVAHEWMGHNEYVRRRANMLAKLGYVAFALDMYGKGVRAKDAQEAAQMSGRFKNDRKLMRERAAAGLEQLRKQPTVDPNRIAVIGYCFGGQVALELGRSGADLKGIVTFHGALDTPTPEDAKNIKGKVLACHGAADPFVPLEHVRDFIQEMENGGVDYRVIAYGPGVVHGFTNPDNKNSTMQGLGYNADADRRSWQAMQEFFNEIFSGNPKR
jgi:dienelactone hydrolase